MSPVSAGRPLTRFDPCMKISSPHLGEYTYRRQARGKACRRSPLEGRTQRTGVVHALSLFHSSREQAADLCYNDHRVLHRRNGPLVGDLHSDHVVHSHDRRNGYLRHSEKVGGHESRVRHGSRDVRSDLRIDRRRRRRSDLHRHNGHGREAHGSRLDMFSSWDSI